MLETKFDVERKIAALEKKADESKEVIDLGRPRTEQDDEIRLLQLRIRALEFKNTRLQKTLASAECPYCETRLVVGDYSPPLEAVPPGSQEAVWHIPARCCKAMREKGLSEKRNLHPIEVECIQDVKRFAERVREKNRLPWWNLRKWIVVLPPGFERTLSAVTSAAEYE